MCDTAAEMCVRAVVLVGSWAQQLLELDAWRLHQVRAAASWRVGGESAVVLVGSWAQQLLDAWHYTRCVQS